MSVTSSYQSILDAVEFDSLTKEEQEKFLLDLNSVIYRGTVARTLERMDKRTREAWAKMIERRASDEEMRAFLERRVPQSDHALADTVDSLAGDILALNQ